MLGYRKVTADNFIFNVNFDHLSERMQYAPTGATDKYNKFVGRQDFNNAFAIAYLTLRTSEFHHNKRIMASKNESVIRFTFRINTHGT